MIPPPARRAKREAPASLFFSPTAASDFVGAPAESPAASKPSPVGRGVRDAKRLAEFSRWENILPDEGLQAVGTALCIALLTSIPHQALRASFPQGKPKRRIDPCRKCIKTPPNRRGDCRVKSNMVNNVVRTWQTDWVWLLCVEKPDEA